MRTWKNRQRPSKKVHRKTISRKQRGGGLISTERVRAWLEANPKQNARYREQVQAALSAGDQQIIIDDQDIRKVNSWEQSSQKSSPFGSAPQQGDPASQSFAQSLRGLDTYRAPGARGSVPPAGAPAPAPSLSPYPEPPTSSATLANSLQGYRAPGLGSDLPVGASVDQANAAANSLLGPGADARLGTALSSANPLAARPPAPGANGLVYKMEGPAGKSQTIQDCNTQLAELREELERLKSGLVKTRENAAAQEAALAAQITELTGKNGELSAAGKAAQDAIAALTQTGQTTAEQLDAASRALAGKGAEFDDISTKLANTLRELGESKSLTASQSEEIGRIKGALEESARNSAKTEGENSARIAKLLADHAAELERLKREHLGELAKLNGDLSSARDAASGVSKASETEKKGLSDKIAELSAAIEAQKDEIAALSSSLGTATSSLEAAQADSAEKSRAAATAAATAAQAAAKSAAELTQLQSDNAELAKQLDAAKEAAKAAGEAAAQSDKAKDAAAAAAAAANARAETATSDAEAAAAAAAAAQANGRTSAAEKEAATKAAAEARALADGAAAAAQEAEAAKNAALAQSEQSNRAKSDAEARLAALKSSTPRIVLIYGSNEGDKVGGGNGRPVIMGERLNVRWEKGAEEPTAWVFTMFSGTNPAYTQLRLQPGEFSFESTVAGKINAVMFDVTVHSREELGI